MALVLGEPPLEGDVCAPLSLLEAGGGSRYKAFVDAEGKAEKGPAEASAEARGKHQKLYVKRTFHARSPSPFRAAKRPQAASSSYELLWHSKARGAQRIGEARS